jgi:hypothetical protein
MSRTFELTCSSPLQRACDVLHSERAHSLTQALVLLQCAVYVQTGVNNNTHDTLTPNRLKPDLVACKTWLDRERADSVGSCVCENRLLFSKRFSKAVSFHTVLMKHEYYL